jgi:hypothetical protein
MTQPYSTESVEDRLNDLGVPFASHFGRALIALLTGRKISLHQVTHLMPGEQNPEANRQQLRRCLDHATLTPEVWSKAIAALLPRDKWTLALDRTEWKRGDTTTNLLVLAVVVHGCSVPLLWTVLPACGSSDTDERIELLSRFVALFGKERLRFVTADREFIGQEWIGWLLSEQIPFRIRIKAGEWLTHPDGRRWRGSDWFDLRACRCKPRHMLLWGLPVYVGQRWKIETLFQALKGRGFDLVSCRLSLGKRLGGWFGFLSLALCWCLKVGTLLEATDPLPLKKHGRRAISVFHRGLNDLQALMSCLAGRPSQALFDRAIDLLCPVK